MLLDNSHLLVLSLNAVNDKRPGQAANARIGVSSIAVTTGRSMRKPRSIDHHHIRR
jgi:hypothetical protein